MQSALMNPLLDPEFLTLFQLPRSDWECFGRRQAISAERLAHSASPRPQATTDLPAMQPTRLAIYC